MASLPKRTTSTKSKDSGYGDSLTKPNVVRKSVRKYSYGERNVYSIQKDSTELEQSDHLPTDLQEAINTLSGLSASEQEGSTIVGAYFVAALLTHIGGILSIPDRDVFLYVPPDAIPENQIQIVYLYIKSCDENGPNLKQTETWLTPLVECGPPGLTFQADVFLSLPHCIGSEESDAASKWKCSSHQGTLTDGHRLWKRIASTNDDDKDGSISVNKGTTFTIAVRHFTIFGVSGEPHGDDSIESAAVLKLVKASVMVKDVEDEPDQLQITVTLDNHDVSIVGFSLCFPLY